MKNSSCQNEADPCIERASADAYSLPSVSLTTSDGVAVTRSWLVIPKRSLRVYGTGLMLELWEYGHWDCM